MFAEQHTPEQVTTYEVARELLGRQLGQALADADAATDPLARTRFEERAAALEVQRQTLRVGSDEAEQILARAKADRGALAAG